jgi:hypothetical protein
LSGQNDATAIPECQFTKT